MSAQMCPGCGVWWTEEHRCPAYAVNTTLTTPRPTGVFSARVHGAESIARRRAQSCLRAALRFDKDSQAAAALRGKARGLSEAADLIRRLDKGQRLPRRDQRESS